MLTLVWSVLGIAALSAASLVLDRHNQAARLTTLRAEDAPQSSSHMPSRALRALDRARL